MLNGGGIFRLGDSRFLSFLKNAAELRPGIPYDAAISNYIKTGLTRDYLHMAHKLQITGLIHGDKQAYVDAIKFRPELVFLHAHDLHELNSMTELLTKVDDVWGEVDRKKCPRMMNSKHPIVDKQKDLRKGVHTVHHNKS